MPTTDIKPIDPPTGPLGRSLLGRRLIGGQPTTAWLCSGLAAQAWDDFLRSCAMGQFQQSSLWARSKETDGWKEIRVIIEQDGRVVGGFQILWKGSRFGRIGYVSKGPVLSPEDSGVMAFVLDLLQELVRSHHFLAIIVQPPDQARLLSQGLLNRGFLLNRFMDVITATCMVDLTGPPGEWERNLGRSRKHKIRQALRGALTVREGGDSEIPKFFELMAATCSRQRVSPNPGSVEALRRLVRIFQGTGEVRLSFADYQGQPIACVMALKFGDRVTIWKKGWSGVRPDLHANSLLHYEA
jgi:peptidoglycan pentaglycine glycine transferase (the first glycine)